jgi:hypothetical protein
MPSATKSEADCIESAYEDAVGTLFTQLFQNMTSQPGDSQELVAHFTTGLNVLREAKQLALGVVNAPQVSAKVISPSVTVKDGKASTLKNP